MLTSDGGHFLAKSGTMESSSLADPSLNGTDGMSCVCTSASLSISSVTAALSTPGDGHGRTGNGHNG